MAWHGIEGHDHIVKMFEHAVRLNRLGSTFLFVGPPGVGKRMFAYQLAKALLCDRSDASQLDSCGTCPGCQQVEARSHPDLLTVRRPKDKKFIPLDLLIGPKDRRMREGLCYDISLKPFLGGRKIAIIDDADYFNQEGANCLLKTLEEPPAKSVIILIGTSLQQQLPTIRSRCQIIRFAPLSSDQIAKLALQIGLADSQAAAQSLADQAQGSMALAARLQNAEIVDFTAEIPRLLLGQEHDALTVARKVNEFVEHAGTDNPARRERLRFVLDVALEHYRQLLCQSASTGGKSVQSSPDSSHELTSNPDLLAVCVDRCLAAQSQLDANAHLATLVECWINDLTRVARS